MTHHPTNRLRARVGRAVLGLVGAALLLVCTANSADTLLTIDGEELVGTITLDPDTDTLTIKPDNGEAKQVPLQDVDRARFGKAKTQKGEPPAPTLNIDNNGKNVSTSRTVKLNAGLHRFVVTFWQETPNRRMVLYVRNPDSKQNVPIDATNMRSLRNLSTKVQPSPGMDKDGYRIPELTVEDANDKRLVMNKARVIRFGTDQDLSFNKASVIGQMDKIGTGFAEAINAGEVPASSSEPKSAMMFYAYFFAPEKAGYQFNLQAAKSGAQLWFGEEHIDELEAGQGSSTGSPWRLELDHGGVALGELRSIADEQLAFHVPLISDATWSLGTVRALWANTPDAPEIDRDKQRTDLDTVYVFQKDKPNAKVRSVEGRIVSLDERGLGFEFQGRVRTIAIEDVVGMVFAHFQRPKPAKPGFHQLLELRGGQVLPARVKAIGETLAFDLVGGGELTPPRDVLKAMRCEDGRRVDLTRVQPTGTEAIPYFGLTIPHRVNESFAGEPIQLFDGKTYPRGLAVHSKSRLYYKLDKPCERFSATLGLMDPGGRLGNITARVIGDKRVLWEKADITADTGAVQVDVALDGVERLVLEVDFGEGQDVGDRAAWCNPRLIFPPLPPAEADPEADPQ